jgi:hypothetical protein
MQWTFHPNGGKSGPRRCDMLCSGIFVSESGLEEDKQLCMLVAEEVMDEKRREEEDEATIRRTEMLRHFPVVARQFSHDGTLIDQNPEALAAFGAPLRALTAEILVQSEEKPSEPEPKSVSNNDIEPRGDLNNSQQQEKSPTSSPNGNNKKISHQPASNAKRIRQEDIIDSSYRTASSPADECDFLAQFVDLDEGKQVLQEVRKGHDYSTETQQATMEGPKWYTVNVRSIKDPVTSIPVIIYSGRDITKVMESAKQEADKQNMKRSEFCKSSAIPGSF